MSQNYSGRNGTLVELEEDFMGLTHGFNMPASLIASASQVAVVSTADCAEDFGWVLGLLRGAFTGSVTVMYDVPFYLGRISNTAAIRALVEIKGSANIVWY
jgi:hypothetical protein